MVFKERKEMDKGKVSVPDCTLLSPDPRPRRADIALDHPLRRADINLEHRLHRPDNGPEP